MLDRTSFEIDAGTQTIKSSESTVKNFKTQVLIDWQSRDLKIRKKGQNTK